MKTLKNIFLKIKKYPKQKIAFTEDFDPRIKQAIKIIKEKNIAEPILIKGENTKEKIERGLKLLSKNKIDGLISGATHPTKDLLIPTFKIIGTEKGIKKASDAMLFEKDNSPMLFIGCAININPSSDDLKDMAISSEKTFKMLTNKKPKIVFLSYSTKGSASGPSVEKIKKAIELIKEFDIEIEGELQADAAICPEISKIKCPDSRIAGQANVLIFPDLNAGNISHKLLHRISGIRFVGPILQGLKKPVNDLSRGCNPQEIVDLTVITALQSIYRKYKD